MFCLERSSKGKAFVFILCFAPPVEVPPPQMQQSYAVKQLKGEQLKCAALLTDDFHLDPISMFIRTMQAGKAREAGPVPSFPRPLSAQLSVYNTHRLHVCALTHTIHTPTHLIPS